MANTTTNGKRTFIDEKKLRILLDEGVGVSRIEFMLLFISEYYYDK